MPSLHRLERKVFDPKERTFSDEETRAMLHAVFNLFDRWELRDDEAATLMGGISPRTYQRWRAGGYGRIGPDVASRLSNLLGIHKALRLLFKDKTRAYGWVKRPNGHLGGKSAIDVMLGGQLTDLMRVRSYLDSQRGFR